MGGGVKSTVAFRVPAASGLVMLVTVMRRAAPAVAVGGARTAIPKPPGDATVSAEEVMRAREAARVAEAERQRLQTELDTFQEGLR